MAEVGKPGVAIRGGVPICWPQFGNFPAAKAPGMAYGFARKSAKWQIAKQTEDSVTLALVSDAETLASWPCAFEFLFTITLGARSLRMSLEVANNGEEPMEFTGCLHTYWRCGAVGQCAVEGLKGAEFDTGIGNAFRGDATEKRASVPFVDEKQTQLFYARASDAITIMEAGRRRLRLTKSNMPDWVLWNTGAENGSNIKDLAAGEYKGYVCVEPTFASSPIRVAPGGVWVASHEAQVL